MIYNWEGFHFYLFFSISSHFTVWNLPSQFDIVPFHFSFGQPILIATFGVHYIGSWLDWTLLVTMNFFWGSCGRWLDYNVGYNHVSQHLGIFHMDKVGGRKSTINQPQCRCVGCPSDHACWLWNNICSISSCTWNDNVIKYDVFMWNWSKNAINDDGIFITSCLNFAIVDKI
jgi:hypothetical protein